MIDVIIRKYKDRLKLLNAHREGKILRILKLPSDGDTVIRVMENMEKTMFDLLILNTTRIITDLKLIKENDGKL